MKKLQKIALTSLFSALIFVSTAFLKVPVASGYVHLGDALIYLCAMLLGSPWAALAGAIGEGLADLAGGYAIYAPATVLIKTAVAFMFFFVPKKRILSLRSVLTSFLCILITVGGYFAADMIIDRTYAVADIPGNIIQAVGSSVVFILLALAFDKSGLPERLRKTN